MKVVCDGCRAKYQIPDERVVGKKLKIRCRRCAGMIILRGDLMQPEAQGGQIVAAPTMSLVPPAAVMPDRASLAPPQPAVEWHVIHGGNQTGPFSTDELAELLSAGQFTWDDYVWREGLDDWGSAAQDASLIEAVQALQGGASGEDDSPTRMFASSTPSHPPVPSHRSQPPRASQRPVAYAGYSQPAQAYADEGLSFGGSPEATTPISSPVVSHSAMTGGRNEDSVLFSASNLGAYTEPVSTPPQGNGYASGDGSGLIDIRALASIAAQSSAPPPGYAASSPPGEDLLRLAHQTGAFSNLDSLAPVSSAPRRSSNALPLAILAGSAIVAVAAFAAVYITRVPQPQAATEVAVAAAAPTAAAAPVEVATPEPAAAPEPEPEPAAVAEADEPEAEQAAEPEPEARPEPKSPARAAAPRAKKARHSAPKRAARAKPRAKAAAKTEPEERAKEEGPSIDDLLLGDSKKSEPEPAATEEPKPKERAKNRSIDDLLETAVEDAKSSESKKASRSSAASALPESPDRSQVLDAMQGVQGAVKACAEGSGGTAQVAITVAGSSGKVTNARVSGVEGPVGSCIAKAVRNAKFPKFSKPNFSINFPFRL